MPLAAVAVIHAKGRAKPYKLTDERGLYLLVTPKGQRYWRFTTSRCARPVAIAYLKSVPNVLRNRLAVS